MLHKIGHSITKLDIRTETPVSVNINENGRLQNKAELLLRKFNLETISEFEEQPQLQMHCQIPTALGVGNGQGLGKEAPRTKKWYAHHGFKDVILQPFGIPAVPVCYI